jgi:hypothetical protein
VIVSLGDGVTQHYYLWNERRERAATRVPGCSLRSLIERNAKTATADETTRFTSLGGEEKLYIERIVELRGRKVVDGIAIHYLPQYHAFYQLYYTTIS